MVEIQNIRAVEKRLKEEEEARLALELKLQLAAEEAQKRKDDEERLLRIVQREMRRKHIESEIALMLKKFNKKYERIKYDLIESAKAKIKAYLANKNNKINIDARFKNMKKEFYAPPTPESIEKEKMMTSYKNIIFAHLDVKLKSAGIQLKETIAQFDKQNKGE